VYPLCGVGDPSKLRDQVLVSLAIPTLFVQGTRDGLCPLDLLDGVRRRMTAHNVLHVVDGGDRSLVVSKTGSKARGVSQARSMARVTKPSLIVCLCRRRPNLSASSQRSMGIITSLRRANHKDQGGLYCASDGGPAARKR